MPGLVETDYRAEGGTLQHFMPVPELHTDSALWRGSEQATRSVPVPWECRRTYDQATMHSHPETPEGRRWTCLIRPQCPAYLVQSLLRYSPFPAMYTARSPTRQL
jgi:hypothetical protein